MIRDLARSIGQGNAREWWSSLDRDEQLGWLAYHRVKHQPQKVKRG